MAHVKIVAGDATNVASDLVTLRNREAALRAAGKTDLADVYKRAIREFDHPAYTGQMNTIGVQHALR